MGWRSKSEKRVDTGDQIENMLGRTSLFRGDISADGAFRIDGWIEGSVESRGTVVIGETGAVRGNVRGTDIVVAGQIFGNVICSGHLEILAKGKIEGDIDALSVRIETGGMFRGTSHMGADATAQATAQATLEASAQPALEASAPASSSTEAADDVPAYEAELSSAA